MSDTTHSVFHAAKRFLSGTLISRCLGLVRDMTMAAAFGVHPSIASFMLAFRLSHFFRRIFGEGAMAAAFAPHYEHLPQEEKKDFFFSLFLATSLFLTVVGILSASILLSIGGETLTLIAIMLPSLLFICLYGITNSLLQCEGSFFAGAAAPALFNVVWIVAVWFFASTPEPEAMHGLAWMVNIACLLQWLFIAPLAYKALKPLPKKVHFRPVLHFLAPFATIVMGTAATQINNAVDPLFAVAADPEGPALLWYALRLQQLPLALFGIAMASALLPPLARAAAKGEHEAGKTLLLFSLKQCIAFMLPITLFYLLFGESLIKLVFQRGDFTNEATQATVACLNGYTLALLPAALVLLVSPAFFARRQNHIPLRGSLVSVVANIGFNALCIFGFGFGAASVAYATAAAAWINLGFLLYHERTFPKNIAGILLANTVATGFSAILPEPIAYLPLLLCGLYPIQDALNRKKLKIISSFAKENP